MPPRTAILALAIAAPFALVLGPGLLRALGRAMRRAPLACCTGCGTQIHPSHGTRCAGCIRRESAISSGWSQIEIDERARQRAIDAERREAERIAARAEVLIIGTVSSDPHGSVVFDGWAFGSLPGMAPGQVVALQGQTSPSALIAGWRQSELHALAHGGHCTCLARMGVRLP